MKTVYLCCESLECLIADIQRAFPDYQGEADFSIEGGGIHLIGDIAIETLDPDTGEVTVSWVGKQHANIFVPDWFDESVFQTQMTEPPAKPVNKIAL